MNWEDILKTGGRKMGSKSRSSDPIMGDSSRYPHDYWKEYVIWRGLDESEADRMMELWQDTKTEKRKVGPLRGPQGRYWLIYRVGGNQRYKR